MTAKKTRASQKRQKSAESQSRTKQKAKARKKLVFFDSFFRILPKSPVFRFVFLCGILCFCALSGFVGYCYFTLPDMAAAAMTRPPKITLTAADGTHIATYGSQYGRPVVLSELPPHVYQAVIAIEDRRFYSHFGIDPRSVARALITNVLKKRKAQGASTITQQVAKNLFLTNEKTFTRKVRELLLAFKLEHLLTKDQILTIYLNRVYLGAGTYGINAAARKYYGIDAKDLNLYQSAVIAGLLKAPTRYNPLAHPEASYKRARVVLATMAQSGFISARKGLNAAESGAKAGQHKNKAFLYFADWVAEELDAYLGSISQDVTVITTLSPKIQKETDKALKDALSSQEAAEKQVSQGAAVVMDRDGAVLAMNGGRDYGQSQFNRAVEAKRQIGSTVKPFVYLAAFENGASPNDVVSDAPVSYGGWTPKNFGNTYYGDITLSEALIRSVNTVAVKTAVKTGVSRVLKTARKFGAVTKDCEPNAAIALGVCQTRLIDLVSAYAALGNGGYGVTPYGITEIIGADGTILYQRSSEGRSRLTNPKYLADLDTVLFDVILRGTGKRANPGIPAKGKSGTTQNYRDAWFVGYTDDVALGVWLGNDDETPTNGVTGGGLPAEIWKNIVKNISYSG